MTFPYKIENNNNVEPGRVFAKYVYISEKSCFEKKVLVIMLLFVTRDLPLFLFLEQYLHYDVFAFGFLFTCFVTNFNKTLQKKILITSILPIEGTIILYE